MDMEVLSKEGFVDELRGEPTVRFTNRGLILFNRRAVAHLHLQDKKGYSPVHICRDRKNLSEFGVFKDAGGWGLKKGTAGGAKFNCVGLARHVIDTTWEKCCVHPVGKDKPSFMVFRIARLPLDDGKNKDVFALLRKKDV